jgi:regulatory protein
VSQVRVHLLGRSLPEADVEAALAELGEQGYLDDARFARRFAEDRRSLDGWGSERIERTLLSSGVDPETIVAALGARGAEDELEAAVTVLRGRLRAAPADERARQRALALLVRRGYELELAYDAVRLFERAAG